MGWLRTLLRWAEAPTAERNDTSVTFSHDIATPVDDVITGHSGWNWPVSRERALSVPPVLRGRNLMCSIATLPLVTKDRADLSVERVALLEQIDPVLTNVVTLAQTIEDLLFDAVSWWRITERFADGFPRRAQHQDVSAVSMQPPPGRNVRTLPSHQRLPVGVVWVHGQPVPATDMIRFDSPNPGILDAAARSIRRAILFEDAASTYANDPRPLDYFRPVDGADPVDDEEIKDILDHWRKSRKDRSTAYVPAALTYETVDTPSPSDLQLVELQKQVAVDIANALGLDSEDLQVSTTSRTYANATDRRRDRINDTLSPYMAAITDRLSMNDITARGKFVEFDLDDYMRADPTTRWNTYQTGLQNNVLSVPEVREMEGLPAVPVEPGSRPRQRTGQQQQESGMSASTTVRFSDNDNDDNVMRVAFELSDADAEFRVNREQRTISGLLIPWNKVARSGFAKWRFGKDSLNWSKTSRVKLNREHDRGSAVGYATRLDSTDKGLEGTFKIARGDSGDEVLSLAEDKVLDGFSVEAAFDDDGASWGVDPNDDMVRLVSSARLVGTAITSAPAFDDARVSGVAATRKESTMKCSKCGHEHAPNVACTAATEAPAETPENVNAFTSAVEAFTSNAGAFTDAVKQLVEVQQRYGEGPEPVDPTKRTAQFGVTEEPMYRFDGTMGQHDFSRDIIAGAKGDYEAIGRVEQWIQQNFNRSAQFVDTTDAGALNPDRQRPDMYVDQLEYPTPIWDAIRKGVIGDNTPFVLPKFESATDMVNPHTEGTEPTPGSLTTTSQTITPSPVSGKVEVTREAWDQGGNPQLSTIIWRQMVRAYNEALEQSAADMLEALTGVTTVTLTAGGTDDEVVTEVKAALAALHFARGGFRFRDFKLEQGLYSKLANAQDSTGRPIFPVLGASNADGTMGQFFGSINVAGLPGVPSWALPFVDAAANNSYLFNREDVHGWASNPQRLDFQYRVAYVDVAIWGYKALATTRTDGVRRITYDNATV